MSDIFFPRAHVCIFALPLPALDQRYTGIPVFRTGSLCTLFSAALMMPGFSVYSFVLMIRKGQMHCAK